MWHNGSHTKGPMCFTVLLKIPASTPEPAVFAYENRVKIIALQILFKISSILVIFVCRVWLDIYKKNSLNLFAICCGLVMFLLLS